MGYEFSAIRTEILDVNPLYGEDSYTGQFSRPAGAASDNSYNIADFIFGTPSIINLGTDTLVSGST